MIRFATCAAFAAVVLSLSSVAQAAGALAVGACAAYGHVYDYPNLFSARRAALLQCGAKCRLATVTRRGCLAFAVDGHNACGPHGYAAAPQLGMAQNEALRLCFKSGGRDCVIRAFACDAKG